MNDSVCGEQLQLVIPIVATRRDVSAAGAARNPLARMPLPSASH